MPASPMLVTGFVVDLKWLKDVIEREVLAAYDHRHLNLEVPEFAREDPDYRKHRHRDMAAPGAGGDDGRRRKLSRVRVYETPEIFAEFRGDA